MSYDASDQYTLDIDSCYPEYSDMNVHDSIFYKNCQNSAQFPTAGPILPSTKFERNYVKEQPYGNMLAPRNNLGVDAVCPIQMPMLKYKLPVLKNIPCSNGYSRGYSRFSDSPQYEHLTVGGTEVSNEALFAFMFIVVVMVFICVYFSRMIAGIHNEIKELRRLIKEMRNSK